MARKFGVKVVYDEAGRVVMLWRDDGGFDEVEELGENMREEEIKLWREREGNREL